MNLNLSNNLSSKKAFTLVELLIVIAILATLASAVIVVLNPGELLSQSRDSQRISNLLAVEKTINLLSFDQPTLSLGTSQTVYLSLPDTTATCASYSLPALPSGWTYKCVVLADLLKTNGTGWIPINFQSITGGSPIATLPIDPTNTVSSYYSYIPSSSSYAISGNLESKKYKGSSSGFFSTKISRGNAPGLLAIPSGGDWINVPGNSTFGTSNFSVMKYEAKCLNSTGSPLSAPDTTLGTYDNASQTCAGTRYIVSVKDGIPIANISHDTAKTYCTTIGAHLITNEEWMTIARNVEQVSSNWSGGSTGSGYIFSGHNDSVPYKALTASTDLDNYAGTGNSSGNQRRTLTLSNGENIWDFSGNVYEHVQRTASDTTSSTTNPTCSSSGWQWCQYGSTTTPYITSYGPDAALSYIGPSNASWNSGQGVGKVLTNAAGSGSIFIRSGSWYDGASAGAFELFLGQLTGFYSNDLGFRCAK